MYAWCRCTICFLFNLSGESKFRHHIVQQVLCVLSNQMLDTEREWYKMKWVYVCKCVQSAVALSPYQMFLTAVCLLYYFTVFLSLPFPLCCKKQTKKQNRCLLSFLLPAIITYPACCVKYDHAAASSVLAVHCISGKMNRPAYSSFWLTLRSCQCSFEGYSTAGKQSSAEQIYAKISLFAPVQSCLCK